MNKQFLLFLLVPLLLGACRHHEDRARVNTRPQPSQTYPRRAYDTQNRTYLERYSKPRPVPVGAWQGNSLHEPQMLGHAAR